MDEARFDRMAAALGGAATRRSGLKAALALLLGIGGREITPGADETGAAPKRHGQREVNGEKRPCGPKARDNRCRKHKDCCTKYCKKPKKGSTAKVGRCRCIKPGKKCTKAQTCCGGARCQNKRCTAASACGATGAACTADASCCSGLVCQNGSCGACAPTVCASGCAFTTVAAAYAAAAAGDTIYLAAGTHQTGLSITRDITFAACPGTTGVILEPDRVYQTPDSYYAIFAEDPNDATTVRSVTLRGLELRGTPAGFTAPKEILLYSNTNGVVAWTLDECTVKDANAFMYSVGQTATLNDTDITGCSYGVYISADTASLAVTGGTFTCGPSYMFYLSANFGALTMSGAAILGGPYYPIYFYGDSGANRGNTTATLTNVTITGGTYSPPYFEGGEILIDGCTISGITASTVGGGLYLSYVAATIKDTSITGNTSSSGGGIYFYSQYAGDALNVTGSTMITGNTSTNFAGGIQWSYGGNGTITGTTTSNVTGNTGFSGADCGRDVNNNNFTKVNCATWQP